MRSVLYYVLIKMNRAFCQYHELAADTQVNNLAYLFKESLEKNFAEKQRVNEYAHIIGVSRVSINNAVKDQFGITASEMIKDRIILEIKSRLHYTIQTISEIAFELNFSEPNNMIRLFKSKVGLTPSQFREKLDQEM